MFELAWPWIFVLLPLPWLARLLLPPADSGEPVLKVSESTFTLTRVANGNRVDASVRYARSTRTATLTPNHLLAPGWYEAVLRGRITDRAGKRLGTRTWRFRVGSGG